MKLEDEDIKRIAEQFSKDAGGKAAANGFIKAAVDAGREQGEKFMEENFINHSIDHYFSARIRGYINDAMDKSIDEVAARAVNKISKKQLEVLVRIVVKDILQDI